MYSTLDFNGSTNADEATSSGRGPAWTRNEMLLLIETYTKYYDSLQNTTGDNEKNAIYRHMWSDYNQKAIAQGLICRTSDQQKDKWKRMVENFKLEFTARHSTGAAGSAVDPVYDKLEELLKRYPTILPPYTYNSYRRSFEGLAGSPSQYTAEHERPEAQQDSEPPLRRRRMETPSPAPTPQPTFPSSAPLPRLPQPTRRRREATLSADTQALINRMDREHELRRGEFRELREYLQRQGDINNSAVNTLLGSIERISTVVERYEARMREIHDRLNQRLN